MSLVGVTIPSNRILQVKSRDGGVFGVVGALRMAPGETLAWALEFKGTQLPSGMNLSGMSAPDPTGDDDTLLTVEDYSADGTQAKFLLALDETADSESDIGLDVTTAPQSGEVFKVSLTVTVGS